MKEGPDIARIGALIGDPARANILTALMSGKALTASELALEAGVTAQTASSHLAKLMDAGLLQQRKQGRHRYFQLRDDEIGNALASIMGLAAKLGHTRTQTGPKDSALRKARVCYDHLAGDLGVRLYDSLVRQGHVSWDGDIRLTEEGRAFIANFGVDEDAFRASRRPVCRSCLDWSSRRTHLAGQLGAAFLQRIYDLGWARRIDGSRIVAFTPSGEKAFLKQFSL